MSLKLLKQTSYSELSDASVFVAIFSPAAQQFLHESVPIY